MKMKKLLVWTSPLILLVAFLVIRGIQKFSSPYEVGFHIQVVEAQTSDDSGPHVGKCPIFPKDNVWNTRIDKLPVSKHSNDYIQSIGRARKVHADFAANPRYGIPYTEVPRGTRPVKVIFSYVDESDEGDYPIPINAPIEGGPENDGDRHVIVIDQAGCTLYELFAAHPLPGGAWKADSGAKFNLSSNDLRHSGFTSADAAGLPIFPGLVRYDEVATGAIRHALRFTVPQTQAAFIWPARHKASNNADKNVPPMGARFRLRADFDISEYSKANQIILIALKRYGMFLADNGSSIFLTGAPDKRWDDDDLHKLGGVTAADFEVVDESSLQLLPDSAKVDPEAIRH